MSVPDNMRECVIRYANRSAAVGVTLGAIPHADIPVMVGLWSAMLVELTELSGKSYNKETLKRISLSAVMAMGTAATAIKLVTFSASVAAAPFTMGLSLLFNLGANTGVNYVTTRAVGMEAAELIMTDELTAENVIRAALAALGIKWKGWGGNGPPNPSDFSL